MNPSCRSENRGKQFQSRALRELGTTAEVYIVRGRSHKSINSATCRNTSRLSLAVASSVNSINALSDLQREGATGHDVECCGS
jgi:hypothetical protein